jgi:hypothetical protein
MEAASFLLEIPLPAKKAAPPFENWIMMGDLISRAASITPWKERRGTTLVLL